MNARTLPRLLCAAVLALPAGAPAAPSAQAQLLRLEARWLRALQAHDVRFLRRLLSDHYIDITYQGGMRDKADVLRARATLGPRYTQRLADEQVRLYGQTGIVTGRGVLFDIGRRRIAAWRFTDVFVRRGGVWKAVSSQETLVRR